MDYAKVQSKIYYGYGQAAKRLGTSYSVYRSTTGIDPISPANLIGTILVSPNVEWTYTRANKYSNNVWNLCVDGTNLRVGDYLVGSSTFFIIGMQPLLPIIGVKCDRMITITEPENGLVPGGIDYSGYTEDRVNVVMRNCPCSFLMGTKGEVSEAKLPMSMKLPWFYVYVPFFGGNVKTGNIITDNGNISYMVGGDEKTELGWRLLAEELGE